MIEKMSESEGKVLGIRAIGDVTREDYEVLTSEAQALIDREGSIGVLLDLEQFRSEKPSAWGADLKFGATYRHKIDKLAVVGDKAWEHLLAKLAAPFYARESKYFRTADRSAAWDWLAAK